MANATWDIGSFHNTNKKVPTLSTTNQLLLSTTRVRNNNNVQSSSAIRRVRSSDGMERGPPTTRNNMNHNNNFNPYQQQQTNNSNNNTNTNSNSWNYPSLSSLTSNTITKDMIENEIQKRRMNKKTYTEPFMEAEYDLHAKLMLKRFCSGNNNTKSSPACNDDNEKDGTTNTIIEYDTIFQYTEQIEYAIQNYHDSVAQYYIELVAATNIISYEQFWLRYLYRCSNETVQRELKEQQILKGGRRGSATGNNTSAASSSIDLSSFGSGIRSAITKSMSGFNLQNQYQQQNNQYQQQNNQYQYGIGDIKRNNSSSHSLSKKTMPSPNNSMNNMSTSLHSSSQHTSRPSYARQASGRRIAQRRMSRNSSNEQLIANMMMISVSDLVDPDDVDNLVVTSLHDSIKKDNTNRE